MALLDDIRIRLQAVSGIEDGTWRIYLSFMPDDRDEAITIYEEPGMPPEGPWKIDYPEISIIVRGTKHGYSAARDKGQDVFDALHNEEALITSSYVSILAANSAPLSLGEDDNRRPLLKWRFKIIKDR